MSYKHDSRQCFKQHITKQSQWGRLYLEPELILWLRTKAIFWYAACNLQVEHVNYVVISIWLQWTYDREKS